MTYSPIAADLRVMAHEGREGVDIGTTGAVFGDRLANIRLGSALGEDAQLGAYNRWPLIEGTCIVGELRDDASGMTVHVDRINGVLMSERKSLYDMEYGLFTYDVHSAIKVVPFLCWATDDAEAALAQQQISEYRDGQQMFIRRLAAARSI
jgi:hypothetical protein